MRAAILLQIGHASVEEFVAWCGEESLLIIGVDVLPGADVLDAAPLPRRCVLVFGAEGPGLSETMVDACVQVVAIPQFGSTRSVNVGVACGIAMHAWCRAHADRPPEIP